MAPLPTAPSPPLLAAGEEAGAGCGCGEEADAGRGEGDEAGAACGEGEEAGAGRGEGEEAGAGRGEGEEAGAGCGEGKEAGAGRGEGEETGAGRGEGEEAGASRGEGEEAGAGRGEGEEADAGRGEGEGCTLYTDGGFSSEVSGTGVAERFTPGGEFSREKRSLSDREGSPPHGDTVFEGGRETVRSGRAAGCAVWCGGRGEECGLDIVEDPSDIRL